MSKVEKLPTRVLGSSGITVSAIGLGCMSLSGIYGSSGDDEGIALIHEALDRGVTLLDTSDAYGSGHNEELVGKAIKGRRSGAPRSAGQSACAGFERSQPEDRSPRPGRASDRRGAERVLAVIPGRSRGELTHHTRAQHQLCRLFAA